MGHRLARSLGPAEIAGDDIADPFAILHMKGIVEPILFDHPADALLTTLEKVGRGRIGRQPLGG